MEEETPTIPSTTEQPTTAETPQVNQPQEGQEGQEGTVEQLNEELEELYKVISGKIRLSVANNHFTSESLEVILSKIVETIEEFQAGRPVKLTGVEKRTIGMNLLRMIIDDLHDHGQINDELYSYFKLGLVFVAPTLFYAAKEAWKKINEIHADVQANGCRGCFGRVCC